VQVFAELCVFARTPASILRNSIYGFAQRRKVPAKLAKKRVKRLNAELQMLNCSLPIAAQSIRRYITRARAENESAGDVANIIWIELEPNLERGALNAEP